MVFPTFSIKIVSHKTKRRTMKSITQLIFALALILFVSSCGDQADCECDNPSDLRSITAGEEQIIESNNNFAFDIFARINEVEINKNLFISPLSISTALSMTANGAKGETKNGIKNTLHQADLTDAEINEAYKTLVEYITELDPKVTMTLANSNWYKQDYHIEDKFREVLNDFYDAEVIAADFDDPGTKDQINTWIDNKTNGKIKDMLDAIPSNAVMYLINAIYLKSTWQYQFDKERTEKMDFALMDGSKIKTDMMFSEGVKVSTYSNQELQYIELPYGNGQFVFSIILPKNPGKLNEIIDNLEIQQFNNFIDNADTSTVQVYLPKFKIEYKLLLNTLLMDMGMEQSFGPNADFSDLFIEELWLAISRVLHQSFIEVDEEGTEAAAATIVEIIELSAGGGSKPTIIVDQPFAFFIREKHSKSILFSGKLIDPTL